MPISCPRCEKTSWHPEDARVGWCGACRAYTSADLFTGQIHVPDVTPIAAIYVWDARLTWECRTDDCDEGGSPRPGDLADTYDAAWAHLRFTHKPPADIAVIVADERTVTT